MKIENIIIHNMLENFSTFSYCSVNNYIFNNNQYHNFYFGIDKTRSTLSKKESEKMLWFLTALGGSLVLWEECTFSSQTKSLLFKLGLLLF